MGQLVFQATLGGAVNLIGPNIASTVNFTLPSADGSSGQTWTTNGSGVLSFGTLGVAGGGTGVTTSTGTGSVVLSNSPTLVTPALGTPSSATLTNATGLPISTGVSGLGTGVATALAVNVGSVGAPVVNGGALGTPSSGTVTNLTGTASININGTVGATTPNTGAFTTTTVSTSETLSYGTANGVTYLNGSKVLTSGSALTFDGTNFATTGSGTLKNLLLSAGTLPAAGNPSISLRSADNVVYHQSGSANTIVLLDSAQNTMQSIGATANIFNISNSEQMRLTSTGLGIGTSSPVSKLDVKKTSNDTVSRTNSIGAFGDWDSLGAGLLLQQTLSSPYGFALQASNAANSVQFPLLLNPSGGNVGIGTSSPSYKLDVVTSGTSGGRIYTAEYGQFVVTDGTRSVYIQNYAGLGSIGTSSNNALAFTTNSVEQMRLDSSGNLGLGVTPSAWAGGKAVQLQFGALSSGYNYSVELSSNAYRDNATWRYLIPATTQAATLYEGISGQHRWFNAPSGTAGNAISFTQAMTLDASGNLGVGTTSPTSGFRLDLQAADAKQRIESTTGTNSVQQRLVNSGGTFYTAIDNSTGSSFGTAYAAVLWHSGNYPMVFATNNTERARIDSSGNLLVGTTSSANTNSNSLIGLPSVGAFVQQHASGTASGTAYNGFNYNGTQIGSITQSGTTAVLYNVTSDQRLKENIADAESASSLIDSLQVRKFDWKSDGTHQRYGFVAQELVTVAPEAVHQPNDTEQMMAVDYSKLVPMLVKEIQSLRARVAQLETN